MWITSATVNENIDMEQEYQQLFDIKNFMNTLWATDDSGYLLPPNNTLAKVVATLAPGAVHQRAWNLESSAHSLVEFIDNHSAKQMTATCDGQQDV